MQQNKSTEINKINVRCGLKNNFGLSNEQHKIFWPVAKAIPLSITIENNWTSNKYSIVFSSKTAVHFFYQNIHSLKPEILQNSASIYCVGIKTKQYFESIFSALSQVKKIYCSQKMGIQNLIDEFSLQTTKEDLLIFTALVGKTQEVVSRTNFNSNAKIIPVYQLESFHSDFLDSLFAADKKKQNNGLDLNTTSFVFECYSGQIFEFAANFLMQYFCCNDILSLPKNIKFLSIGTSAIEKERQFYEK